LPSHTIKAVAGLGVATPAKIEPIASQRRTCRVPFNFGKNIGLTVTVNRFRSSQNRATTTTYSSTTTVQP
jgi:hypothetical protein